MRRARLEEDHKAIHLQLFTQEGEARVLREEMERREREEGQGADKTREEPSPS